MQTTRSTRRTRWVVLIGLAIVTVGCGGRRLPVADAPGPTAEDGAPKTSTVDWTETVLAAAKDYTTYGNVDDAMHWAPTLCRVPPLQIRDSRSPDEGTHGRKLYWLHAKDRDAYLASSQGQAQPVGQVIVKEAFAAVPGEAPEERGPRRFVVRTVERGGRPYHAGEPTALFLMIKVGAEREGTDEGWIYATTTPDGSEVTAAGRIASCMKCHAREETHDRMFGPAAPEKR